VFKKIHENYQAVSYCIGFFFSCSVAQASYFEYCYLDGQVVAVSKAKKKSSKIEFLVSRSVASTLKEEHSYSPQVCANYIGKTIKIKFHTESRRRNILLANS
jgi:hypothetical protein